jgi:hypothetical protein
MTTTDFNFEHFDPNFETSFITMDEFKDAEKRLAKC